MAERKHLYKSENASSSTKRANAFKSTSEVMSSIADHDRSIQVRTPSSYTRVETTSSQHKNSRVNFGVSQEGFQAHTEVGTISVRPNNGGGSVSISIPIACKIM